MFCPDLTLATIAHDIRQVALGRDLQVAGMPGLRESLRRMNTIKDPLALASISPSLKSQIHPR